MSPQGTLVVLALLLALSGADTAAADTCTCPQVDTAKPTCFVPLSISQQAQQALQKLCKAAAATAGSKPPDLLHDMEAVAAIRQTLTRNLANASRAALEQYMHTTRRDAIAGIPVVFGVPKGIEQRKPADTQLIFYIHGGGYVAGSCQSQWSAVALVAAKAGLTVLCVDYRLAPEHPFPAGLNDVLAVYKTLIQGQGYSARNIVLLGDSAGGGMVAAAAIQLRREDVPLPAALGMLSPWVELEKPLDTGVSLVGFDPKLDPAAMDPRAEAYVGGNKQLFADPLVSPLRADFKELFSGGRLPPVLVQAGTRERFLSGAVMLFRKMKAAAPAHGCVEFSPYEGMWHVFQMSLELPEAQVANAEMAAFFKWSLSDAAVASGCRI